MKPNEDVLVRKYWDQNQIQKLNEELLANIKKKLPALKKLLKKSMDHWVYEDYIYRFYHHSFKVFWIQGHTVEIVKILKELAPEGVTEFDSYFEEIFKQGTGKQFKSKYNKAWTKHTRPILEAFFHAKYMLEMAIKYGKELETAPTYLPSGWAGLLTLYNLR
jgi:hypothetical protein